MRQEAHDRGGYDSGGSCCSAAGPGDAGRAAAAAAAKGSNPPEDLAHVLDRPEHRSAAAGIAGGDAAPSSPSTSPLTGPPSGAPDSDYGEALSASEWGKHLHRDDAARISTAVGQPQHFSPPPQAPLTAPHNDTQQQDQHPHLRQGHRDAASSSSRGGSSSRYYANQRHLDGEHDAHHHHAHPRLSPDAVFKCGHDGAPFSQNSSFTTAAAASAPRRQSATDRVCRTSCSVSSIADLYGHADRTTSASRRFSLGRSSSTQSRKYIDSTLPSTAHRAGARQDRCGSITRVEASLVALQVELAAEKRNNIEAEHHITTLNREVKRLREENARLSREVAVAATAAHGASAPPHSVAPGGGEDGAGAAFLSSTAHANSNAVAAERRIEALEARLGELSRNMETKQRELDTKDERIRLLEHKLADQLLLYSGMSYMEGMSTSPPQALQPAAMVRHNSPTAPKHQQQRRPSRTRQKGSEKVSSVGAHASPSRLYWQAQAPDTTLAGPKVSAIRSVSVRNLHVGRSDNGGSAGAWGEGAPTHAGPQPSAFSLRESQPNARVDRPLSATRNLRQQTPRTSSVRRRPYSTSSQPGSSDLSAGTRSAAGTHSSARRRCSRGAFGSVGHADGDDAVGRTASGLEKAHPSDRSGPASSPRRPSVQRRTSSSSLRSARTATREDSQRASSRRNSAASPARRNSGSIAIGSHPMRLSVGASAGGDARVPSPGSPAYGRAQSIFLSNDSTARRGSATRSVAQQSVHSGTSTRSRPQITYSADNESATIKGSTTTVVFRSGNATNASVHSYYGGSSYARDGAPLLPSRLTASGPVVASGDTGTGAAVDLP
ncbi:conserved hypothetical protein [Leishmania major strain Friedlin]|uniref:Uncharacterized protein n=1 Tax=Leishmania major TaxID=5664 RepID=Q4QE71_LEIMA|nr:conserved hypothetical protein [Leishmania major strain Friedlin]CAG9572353.1 hypothetical_protein_-_conserved [Leishmania major strain Friedlin]CAJ03930.1 conserved hypothetical protein [Leishmania major strain Friedlin]|eukprot:XP_001682377.1 conserved hypothetical protein [Leishmania major strain Friedlin]